MTHRHRAHTIEIKPYSGCIARPCNPAAHDGVCEIERCKCGAWRATNRHWEHTERGLWETAEPKRGPGRPRLDDASVFIRMRRKLYLQLSELAREAGLPLATWARGVLEREATDTPSAPRTTHTAPRHPDTTPET